LPQSSNASQPFSTSFFQRQQEEAADTTELGAGEGNTVTEKSVGRPKRRSVDVHTSMRYLQSKGILVAVLEKTLQPQIITARFALCSK